MKHIDVLNKALKDLGIELEPMAKRTILRELLPIEKLPAPHLRKNLERRIYAGYNSVGALEKKAELRLMGALDRHEKALKERRRGGDDRTEDTAQAIIDVHRFYMNEILKIVLRCTLDAVQLTDNISIRLINKDTRDYADGYLSHYNQAVGKLKSLKDRTWI